MELLSNQKYSTQQRKHPTKPKGNPQNRTPAHLIASRGHIQNIQETPQLNSKMQATQF